VLGIVGLVIGGIWVATAEVQRRHNLSRDYALVLSGVEKIRSLYKDKLCLGCGESWDPAVSISMGIVPANLQKGTGTVSYSGFQMRLPQNVSNNGSIYSHGISISFSGVDRASCIQLATKFAANTQVLYLWVMDQNNGNYTDFSSNVDDGAQYTLPANNSALSAVIKNFASCGDIGFIFAL